MKRSPGTTSTGFALLLIGALALVFTLAAPASAPRTGVLNVTKECSEYDFGAGAFCTITSSTLDAIPAGSKVVYASPADFEHGVLDSDLVVYTRGANAAYGHVVLDLGTGTGTVTFSGGSGQFKQFSATVDVSPSPLGWPNVDWTGSYSY
jgi:hypothetical protein